MHVLSSKKALAKPIANRAAESIQVESEAPENGEYMQYIIKKGIIASDQIKNKAYQHNATIIERQS